MGRVGIGGREAENFVVACDGSVALVNQVIHFSGLERGGDDHRLIRFWIMHGFIDVLWLIVREGIVLALAGAPVGIGVALSVTRFLKAMLYNVSAYDPATIIAVAALPVFVALVACWIPARMAMNVDPIVALRCE